MKRKYRKIALKKNHQLLDCHYNSASAQHYVYWCHNKGIYSNLAAGAAANGSILHRMLLKDQISVREFSAGFAFIKLHALVMRSKGIKNRLRTYCQNWENIVGISHDNFCSFKLESMWNKLLLILTQKNEYKDLLLGLVFSLRGVQYSLTQMKSALAFLHDFWQFCEKTTYRKYANRLLSTKDLLQLD